MPVLIAVEATQCHIVVACLLSSSFILEGLMEHSGYNFPMSLSAERHNFHHAKLVLSIRRQAQGPDLTQVTNTLISVGRGRQNPIKRMFLSGSYQQMH